MRRSLIILIALLGIAATTQAQNASLYGVVSGSGVTNSDFTAWKGGLQLGTSVPLDSDKGLMLRTLYTKVEFGKGDIQSIRISPLLQWYAGKRWTFYVNLGGDAPLTDDATGAYFVGIGASRRIYTADATAWLVPFTIDWFGDFTTADPSGSGSNINQINIGFQFSKPVHN